MAFALRIDAQAHHLPDPDVGTSPALPLVGYYDDVPEYTTLTGFWNIVGFNLWCFCMIIVACIVFVLWKTGVCDVINRLSSKRRVHVHTRPM